MYNKTFGNKHFNSSMEENPLIIKDRLGHEDIETTLGIYRHLYSYSNFEIVIKLNGVISFKEVKKILNSSPKIQFLQAIHTTYKTKKEP